MLFFIRRRHANLVVVLTQAKHCAFIQPFADAKRRLTR